MIKQPRAWNEYALTSALALVALVVAYYGSGEPRWVAGIDVSYLSFGGEFRARDILFICEFAAWGVAVFTRAMTLIARIGGDSGRQSPRVLFSAPWFVWELALFFGVLSYHVYAAAGEGWQLSQRLPLAIFSWVIIRSIVLNSRDLGFRMLPAIERKLSAMGADGGDLVSAGSSLRHEFAYAISVLFLVVACLVVWSPSLITAGPSPRYMSIVAALVVVLSSLGLTLYVQHKIFMAYDLRMRPIDLEVARLAFGAPVKKSDIESANSLLQFTGEMRKAYHLPVVAVLLNLLQVAGLAAALLFALMGGGDK